MDHDRQYPHPEIHQVILERIVFLLLSLSVILWGLLSHKWGF
jgi:hypothetical protein